MLCGCSLVNGPVRGLVMLRQTSTTGPGGTPLMSFSSGPLTDALSQSQHIKDPDACKACANPSLMRSSRTLHLRGTQTDGRQEARHCAPPPPREASDSHKLLLMTTVLVDGWVSEPASVHPIYSLMKTSLSCWSERCCSGPKMCVQKYLHQITFFY